MPEFLDHLNPPPLTLQGREESHINEDIIGQVINMQHRNAVE